MDHPLLAVIVEDKKASTRWKNLIWCTTGLLTVMDVKSHAVTTDYNCTSSTISIRKATPVTKDDYLTTRTTLGCDSSAQSTVSQNPDMKYRESEKNAVGKAVDDCHRLGDLVRKVHCYLYTPKK